MEQNIYKKDISGNILQWSIRVKFIDDNLSKIITKYGMLNGGLVETTKNITQGKNIGKSNETSVYEQAIKEAKSTFNDKLKSGYKTLEMLDIKSEDVGLVEGLHQLLDSVLSSDDTTSDGQLLPMKCKVFERNKIQYPRYGEPKINGCRAWITGRKTKQLDLFTNKEYEIVIFAKRGDEFELPTLQSKLENIKVKDIQLAKYLTENNIILDGECYIAGYPPPSISGACRNKNNPLNQRMGIIIFDTANKDTTQHERKLELLSLNISLLDIKKLSVFENDIKVLQFIKINSDDEAYQYMHYFISCGAEGIILRDIFAKYRFGKRTTTIMKLKETKDSEFIVINIVKNDGNEGAKFICKNDINDETFEVSCLGSMDKQRIYIESKINYIGKLAKVKFYERTKNGLPFNATLMYFV